VTGIPNPFGSAVAGYSITTYRFSLSVSCCPTYFPISLSNCAQDFHGRYSLNSRTMRGPAPGMLRMSSSVAVLSFSGMKQYCASLAVEGGPTDLTHYN
jgi:hypothetical protein